MLGYCLYSLLHIVLLQKCELNLSIEVQQYCNVLDCVACIDTIFDVRQAFLQRSQAFLSLLFQLLESILQVFQMFLSLGSFNKFVVQMV